MKGDNACLVFRMFSTNERTREQQRNERIMLSQLKEFKQLIVQVKACCEFMSLFY